MAKVKVKGKRGQELSPPMLPEVLRNEFDAAALERARQRIAHYHRDMGGFRSDAGHEPVRNAMN